MTTTADHISDDQLHCETRLVVVAPTFNNVHTLRGVLNALTARALPVIAVNDGSTDATRVELDAWLADASVGKYVLHHPINRGKAAALRTGFAHARSLAYTHALTFDTDGQHAADDVAALTDILAKSPAALIVGDRPCGRGYPLRSRLGRLVSNAFVRWNSGARVGDTQCGLRIYPLSIVEALNAHTDRYAFETEILIRAAWAGVPIVGAPVRCIYDVAAGRVTHFRVLRDSLSASAMHARLLTRSLWPWSPRRLVAWREEADTAGTLFDRGRRWLNPMRSWRALRRDASERERIGPSMGWGIFVGTQPPLGYKGVLCLLIAKKFRLQPLIVLGASSLSTPPLGFVLWGSAIVVGHLLLHGTLPNASQYDLAARGVMPVLRAVALEWIVGGVVFGAALGLTTSLVASLVVRSFSMSRSVSRITTDAS